ncbi:PROTEIN SIEVE ELEMENT OCCLUSION B-LIKE [Salix koriyanagi]|uniref:PROTEIN SIEVE ELEMENT OCCLUSION B-LIKE n=1 Tax=Salix koriyanagi TaxID=2511006 RepID=A0A9Q1AH80_9ROSI|nr:PROTEIN SIEVE ELEMENT OCCLUSION B-LIKE [Salix koriyanagi]
MALVPHLKAPRRERNMFTSSDDTAMMKQIQATHAPDGREFSVKPLLHIVEDIFLRATTTVPGITDNAQQQGAHQAQVDELEEKALQNGFHETIEMLSYNINKISCEMSCKCSGGGDAHATTVAIFNLVSNYSWDEKGGASVGWIRRELWGVLACRPALPHKPTS